MMLMQQAPTLLKAIQGAVPGSYPGVEDALNSQYDPVNMENVLKHYMNNNPHPESMSALDYVDSIYGADNYDGPKAFPSDGAENGLSNLFRTLNPDQWKYVGGPQAALSAATFENTPMPDDEFLAGFDNSPQAIPDPYTTPNPATGYSPEDWDFDEVDDVADNPYAKNALLEKIRKKRGK